MGYEPMQEPNSKIQNFQTYTDPTQKRHPKFYLNVKKCLQRSESIHKPRSATNKTKNEKPYRERESLQDGRTTKQRRRLQDWRTRLDSVPLQQERKNLARKVPNK